MRYNPSHYLIATLCVLSAAFATPTKGLQVPAPGDGGSASNLKLGQTTWEEIRARQNSRTKSLFKRQMPSAAVPIVYPTCSATYSDVSVARYVATDIIEGDSAMAFGPISAINENACLQICIEAADCIGHFYWASNFACFPKSSWSPSSFSSTSTAARSAGAVAGLLGSCSAATANGVPSRFGSVCCNSAATSLSVNQCPVTVSWAKVARVVNADLPGYDSTSLVGGTEDQCIQRCMQLSECVAYFYYPAGNTCWMKRAGFSGNIIVTTGAAALARGSVTGIIGQTCSQMRTFLKADAYAKCCDY